MRPRNIRARYTLRAFYLRRFLRIAPAYFAALVVVAYFNVAGIRDTWLWHAAYLTNFHIFLRNDWIGLVGHFWTLSVEEQFYLAWPSWCSALPWRLLPAMFLSVAAAQRDLPLRRRGLLPRPGDVESADAGISRQLRAGSPARLPPPLAERRLRGDPPRGSGTVIARLLRDGRASQANAGVALVFLDPLLFALAYTVPRQHRRERGTRAARLVLNQPLLRYAGRISYGLYLAHNFAPLPVRAIAGPLSVAAGDPQDPAGADGRLHDAGGDAVLALYESPINGLKKYFPYARPPAQERPAAATPTTATDLGNPAAREA